MKKIILLFFIFLLVLIPAYSFSLYLGATADAMYSFYLPYDLSRWGDGFWGKARFPLGGSFMLTFDPLPFAFEVGGGYCPEVNVGLDSKDNSMPFYAEVLAYYDSTWRSDPTETKNYVGGGLGVFFGEFPVLDVICENKWIWTPMKHLFLSLGMRIDASFDFEGKDSDMALGFLQMGLGVKTGVGVTF